MSRIAVPLELSKRVDLVVQSEIRNMSIECDRVGGLNLAQGVCDTEVPIDVRRGAQAAMDGGVNSYTRYDGIDEIRRAISRKMRSYNSIDADPDGEIVVSAGATGAFFSTCLGLLDPGDEVILFEPFYGYHLNTLLAVEAVPRYVEMTPPDWTFTEDALEAAVTPRTKAIVCCTPANPSGKVFTTKEVAQVADLAERHDLFVFTDEIYEYFLYDGRKHVSPASFSGLKERSITISGYSKTFSITGWRVGYLVAAARWARVIGYMSDLVYVCAPAPLQRGVADGIDALDESFYAALIGDYTAKRRIICDALAGAGLTPFVPQGAYYVLVDASSLPGTTSKDRAMYLLEKTGVATVPGKAFYHGAGGDRILRFCFAKTDSELDEACQRLGRLR